MSKKLLTQIQVYDKEQLSLTIKQMKKKCQILLH